VLLRIGQVLNTKGLQGEIKVIFFYSYFSIKENDILFFEKEKNIFGPHKILYFRNYKVSKDGRNICILKLHEIDSVEKSNILIKSFVGQEIKVLPENIFIVSELKQCALFNAEDVMVGKIIGVIEVKRGYSLLVVIKNSGEEIFVPFIKEVINLVDINSKKVMLKNVEGILDQ